PRTAPHQKRLAQLVTFVLGLTALVFTFIAPSTLVQLSVLSYQGIAQLLPVVLLSLLWKRMSTVAGACGLACGVVTVVLFAATGHETWHGINSGLVGLALNLAVTGLITWFKPADTPADQLAVDERTTPVTSLSSST